jgi:hypothetical protein
MASSSGLPELATVQQPSDTQSSFKSQLELMQQMLREQQQTIAALQQEVKQLKGQATTSTPPTGSYRGRFFLMTCLAKPQMVIKESGTYRS